jgi:hypothetical protein
VGFVVDARCGCIFFFWYVVFQDYKLYFSPALSIHETRTVSCGSFQKKKNNTMA